MTVVLIVFVSVSLSLWLFWRSLYLPELKNHANYLASEIAMIDKVKNHWTGTPALRDWLYDSTHLKIVTDPQDFPQVVDKVFVNLFTDVLADEIGRKLGRDVQVYFKFKPTPNFGYKTVKIKIFGCLSQFIITRNTAQGYLLAFGGLPILTVLTCVWLIRALNRPLKRLEYAASDYITKGTITTLPTKTGPSEIRHVNTAFNQLFTTLNQTQKERTIMLAGISHDLRTPLTRMRLTAEMLPDEFFKEGLIYDIEDMDAILEQFMSFMKDGSDEKHAPLA